MVIKSHYPTRLPIYTIVICSLVIIASCDSSNDNIPVQHVDSQDRLSDLELQQEQMREQDKHQLEHEQPEHQHRTYLFGFDLRASPQEDVSQYRPFLNYLERATGYNFKLHFTPKNTSTADELGQNITQFAAMGATSFLYAQSRYQAKSMVRGVNYEGKAEYQSVFVVNPDSPIRNISNIKSHRLAFGSRDSTQGHLIPRIVLAKNGVSLDDLQTYEYTGSHQNCAEAVVSSKLEVCGMQDQLAKTLASQGKLKIIHSSQYYPSSGIVVNKLVHPDVVERIQKALLDFDPQGKHGQDLYHWDRTEMPNGFIASKEGDYDELYQWSVRLGFMKNNYDKE